MIKYTVAYSGPREARKIGKQDKYLNPQPIRMIVKFDQVCNNFIIPGNYVPVRQFDAIMSADVHIFEKESNFDCLNFLYCEAHNEFLLFQNF